MPLLFVPPTINKFYVLDSRPGAEHGRALRRRRASRCSRSRGAIPTRPRATSTSTPTRRRSPRPATRSRRSRPRRKVHIAAACSGGIITAGAARSARRDRRAGRGREPDADGVRARQRHRGHDGRARHPRRRGGRRRRVSAQGLPRRAGARRRVHVAAPERPRLELRRQQLPARQGRRRRSTSSTGTRTRSGSRPGCTATSSTSALRQLVHPSGCARGARARRSTSATVDIDTYFVAGASDHIVPWESAYTGALLFGGSKRFVLSRSGHIQALVNPPSAGRAASSFRVADEPAGDARGVRSPQTPQLPGSWWPDWDAWLAERSGGLQAGARGARQPRRYKAQAKAPGTLCTCRLTSSRRVPRASAGGATTCARRAGRSSSRGCSPIRCSTGVGCRAATAAPVMLMPGFGGGDQTLLVLAAWLRRIGYRPHMCGFVANTGCSDRAVDRVERRLREDPRHVTGAAWR